MRWSWLASKAPAPACPPVPGTNPGAGDAPAPAQVPPKSPAPGHHRGDHMVIDTWECGCIYTWTRHTGWGHDFDCFDEKLRELLS